MQYGQDCFDLVRAWEGLPDGDTSTVNLDPYMDPVGIWTIGYGRAQRGPDGKYLIGAKDRAAAFGQYPGGITREQAYAMLREDLKADSPAVVKLAGPGTTQPQFDALLSFQFNIGALASSTLLKLHKLGAAAGGALNDGAVRTLAERVRDRQVRSPASIVEGFAAFSFSTKGRQKVFLGGLFCRRLAEWRLYAGDGADAANTFGVHVRSIIAKLPPAAAA